MARSSSARTLIVLTGLFVLASPGRAEATRWQRPVDGAIVRPFHLSPDRFAAGQHRGIELAARPGERVRAACGGRVRFAGRVPGGGRTLTVACGRLLATYQHLSHTAVRHGQGIVPGMALGRAGPRLYLSARVASTRRHLDPRTLLGERPRMPPVLGPAPRGRGPHSSPPPAPVPVPVPVARPISAPAVPWAAWAGLACLAPAIGLGGLIRRRRRAVRAREVSHAPQ